MEKERRQGHLHPVEPGQILYNLLSQVQCLTYVAASTFGIHLGIKVTLQPEEDGHICLEK